MLFWRGGFLSCLCILYSQDYKELQVPLSDIPVNATTCSELVRLCLTKQDVSDEKSDTSEDMEDAEDEVVSLILVSCLLSCSGSRSGSGSSSYGWNRQTVKVQCWLFTYSYIYNHLA